MRRTSLQLYCLAVTATVLAGLLVTSRAHANPITYDGRGSDGARSATFAVGPSVSSYETFQSPRIDALPFDSTELTYSVALSVLPIASIGRGSQDAILNNNATPTPADPGKLKSTDVSLLLEQLFVDSTQLRTAVSSLAEAVPQPSALILLGSCFLGLAVGIRRITTRKDSDNKSDWEEREVGIAAELEANDPEVELAGPTAAPVLRQNETGRTDSISMSQSS